MLILGARASCGLLIRIQIDGSEDSVGLRQLEKVTKPITEEEEELMSIKEMIVLLKILQIRQQIHTKCHWIKHISQATIIGASIELVLTNAKKDVRQQKTLFVNRLIT
jgi:hypothetical protein